MAPPCGIQAAVPQHLYQGGELWGTLLLEIEVKNLCNSD